MKQCWLLVTIMGVGRVIPFLAQKKKRKEKSQEKFGKFVGQGRYKKTTKISVKKKAKNLSWLDSCFS